MRTALLVTRNYTQNPADFSIRTRTQAMSHGEVVLVVVVVIVVVVLGVVVVVG